MAYDKEKIYQESLKLIEDSKLLFIEDVVALLPCTKSTFYEFFPLESDEMNRVKELLQRNRVTIKSNMRKKWYDSDNPTLQIALMRIISEPMEYERLSGRHSGKQANNEPMQAPKITFTRKEKPKDN